MFPWSVVPTAGWPSEAAAATTSPIRDAPSSIEYSVWRCRWTNESVRAPPSGRPSTGPVDRVVDESHECDYPTAGRPRNARVGRSAGSATVGGDERDEHLVGGERAVAGPQLHLLRQCGIDERDRVARREHDVADPTGNASRRARSEQLLVEHLGARPHPRLRAQQVARGREEVARR